jgi:hypothetical protein
VFFVDRKQVDDAIVSVRKLFSNHTTVDWLGECLAAGYRRLIRIDGHEFAVLDLWLSRISLTSYRIRMFASERKGKIQPLPKPIGVLLSAHKPYRTAMFRRPESFVAPLNPETAVNPYVSN